MKNILVIKLRYLGDVLLATPLLHVLHEKFHDAKLTAAVNRGTEDILNQNPDVTDVLVVDRGSLADQVKFVRELRRRRFDCVVDLTDADRSAILSRLSGAPIRIGFNQEHRWRGLLFTAVVPVPPSVVHRIDRDLEAIRLFGVTPKPAPLVLNTSFQDEVEADRLLGEVGFNIDRPIVMLQPGARYWFKAWPAERFADIADRLADEFGCQVLIGGGQAEHDVAEAIVRKARSSPVSLAGRTTVLQYAAILKRCSLFIGNDNGPMHMSAALGIPVVALFGPSDPLVWGPRGRKIEVLYKGLDCRDCFHPTCRRGEESCMKQITVDEVFAAAERSLVGKSENALR